MRWAEEVYSFTTLFIESLIDGLGTLLLYLSTAFTVAEDIST